MERDDVIKAVLSGPRDANMAPSALARYAVEVADSLGKLDKREHAGTAPETKAARKPAKVGRKAAHKRTAAKRADKPRVGEFVIDLTELATGGKVSGKALARAIDKADKAQERKAKPAKAAAKPKAKRKPAAKPAKAKAKAERKPAAKPAKAKAKPAKADKPAAKPAPESKPAEVKAEAKVIPPPADRATDFPFGANAPAIVYGRGE